MADTQITIKFQYYVPFIKNAQADTITLFDFQRWIAKTEALSLEALVRENLGIKARLDISEAVYGKELWFFRFLRLREDNLPFMVKNSTTAEGFELDEDEYVAEGLNTIYDARRKQFMIQASRNSLGVSALQNYLTDVWGEADEKIVLKPIMKIIDLKRFRKGIYRKIEIGFANIPNDVGDRNVSFLKGVFDSFSNVRCKTATMSMSIGHAPKADSLENGSINSLLLDVSDNTDIIKRAVLKCSDDEMEKSEVINLLNCVEEDIITFTYPSRKSIAYEFMRDEMCRIYEPRANTIEAAREK